MVDGGEVVRGSRKGDEVVVGVKRVITTRWRWERWWKVVEEVTG